MVVRLRPGADGHILGHRVHSGWRDWSSAVADSASYRRSHAFRMLIQLLEGMGWSLVYQVNSGHKLLAD